MPVQKLTAKLGLPWGIGEIGGEWVPGEKEVDAAWELYVELLTRVSLAELPSDRGLLREALSSLHSIFATTRDILRRYGPEVARPLSGSDVSFAHLAIAVLNGAVRPFLSRWNPLLTGYEHERPRETSIAEWERGWELNQDFRSDLAVVRNVLTSMAGILGDVCDAKTLLRVVNYVPTPPEMQESS